MNAGEIIAGKYRVLRPLGQGGMGLVVLAEHVHLGEHVAVKVMTRESASADASQRFLREARAAAKLKGEHIARATDFGVLDSGAAYIVLEYLEGEDLGAHIRRIGRVVTPEAVSFVLQACEGIAEAHAAGIVHRDLKPSNLFLTRRPDGSALVKVLDFGVAKSSLPGAVGPAAGLTNTGVMMGSPIYMSPEQLKSSKDVGPASDVWALCVVLFELLTGRQPFVGETFPAIAGAILYVPSPDPCADRRAIPRALGDVVLKGLAKAPTDRFASVGELARALAPFANEEAHVHAVRASRILREAELPQRESFASHPGVITGQAGPGTGSQPGAPGVTPHPYAITPGGAAAGRHTPHAFSPYGAAPAPPASPASPYGAAPPTPPMPAGGTVPHAAAPAPAGPTTTASYISGPLVTAPPVSRSPLPYVLGGLLVVLVLGGAGLAASRLVAKPTAPEAPTPSTSVAATASPPSAPPPAPSQVPTSPQGAASAAPGASHAPSATAPAAKTVAKPGTGKPAAPATPPPSAAPAPTPAPAPAPPKVDCSNPVITDPVTGAVRVKPGCR